MHPGLTCFRDGIKEIPVETIPGVLEAGYVPPEKSGNSSRNTRNSDERANDSEALYNTCKAILNGVRSHQSAWPFMAPVDRKVVSIELPIIP